jgi:putative NADH-flavin reductase
MRNKILVLGATGNIGSFLVGNLKKRDASFVAGVQTDAEKKNLQQDEILGKKYYRSGEAERNKIYSPLIIDGYQPLFTSSTFPASRSH